MNRAFAAIEAIERAAWVDIYEAAPAEFARQAGLSSARIDDVAILCLSAAPDTQFNRILGLGVDRPATAELLDMAVDRMKAGGNARYFLHVVPWAEPKELAAWLGGYGLQRYHRPWAKFHRGPTLPPDISTAFRLAEIGPERAMDFARPVAAGFGAPPPFQFWLAALPGRAGWRVYVAYDGSEPVAGAALYIHDATAWLGIAATLPSHRGQGGQGALMARRIADAIAEGCRDIATETGVPVPGQANSSYFNMLRCGFEVAYLRDNYLPSSEGSGQLQA